MSNFTKIDCRLNFFVLTFGGSAAMFAKQHAVSSSNASAVTQKLAALSGGSGTGFVERGTGNFLFTSLLQDDNLFLEL